MKRQQLVETLTKCGFSVINQASWGKARLSGDMSGSLYAADNYLSATGDYALFREKVPPSERDHSDYPIWRTKICAKSYRLSAAMKRIEDIFKKIIEG